MHYRSQLFVPGNRPDRFEKACTAGADLVCIDLEDAVGSSEKDSARNTVLDFLASTKHKHVSLRINSLDTPFAKDDIAALKTSELKLPFLMIPKTVSKSEIADLDDDLPNDLGPFFAIIESAVGLLNAADIFSVGRVKLGMYGAVDYAGDVGCDLSWESHLYARSHCVAAAIAHDVQLFDVPHIDVRDLDDCEATTRKAKALGIYARSAIHPAQIARIHAALAPSKDEVSHAQRVIAAYQSAGGNVALLDGKFIEAPVVKAAQRVLEFAKLS
ncbi:HpcH/HpaI aldolase/citrate lyase family protein [Robiginitomaculum antarcticum]|uniref:HpcH/HpaI aldolase/citrate lyase family protein n=1 Tax=Robiginitomaculum antarcticum TaxID=437507 RepID=UPI00035F0049|nr:CoA ester lyase [Robiginitomaculum antarcticum]